MNIKHILTLSITALITSVVIIGTPNHAFLQTVDTLINPDFEKQGDTSERAYDWQDFHSGYTRVSTSHTGNWGISMSNASDNVLSGAYQRIDFQQIEQNPVFVGAWVKGDNIVNSSGGYFGASIYAEIHLQDGTVAYWNTVANYGTFNWRWIGFNTGTLPHVNQPIDYIFVVPLLGNASGTAYFDDLTVAEFEPSQSAVTLMFDDGKITDYTIAKPILDTYGFKGSSAVVTGEIGNPDHMTLAQIQELAEVGWEVVSHAVTHEDLTLKTPSELDQELQDSRNFLASNDLEVKNLALPFGAFNDLVLAEGAKYYRSVRRYEQGNNPQGSYPHEVKVRGLLDTTTDAEITEWLNQASANNEWVVLVFHDLINIGDDAYHTSPARFAEIVELVDNSGIPVVTYDQGLDLFAVESPIMIEPPVITPPEEEPSKVLIPEIVLPSTVPDSIAESINLDLLTIAQGLNNDLATIEEFIETKINNIQQSFSSMFPGLNINLPRFPKFSSFR